MPHGDFDQWLGVFGLPQSLSTFVGGWVGFLGVEKIRALADRYANFKLPSSKAGE